MIPSKKIKFSDIVRLKKGDTMPEGTNALPLEAAKAAKEESLFDCFKEIENGKWYGTLTHSLSGARFVFRHGACQSFTKKIQLWNADFEMNIINTNIDFRKDDKHESAN